jgi:hypothetical protein
MEKIPHAREIARTAFGSDGGADFSLARPQADSRAKPLGGGISG